MPRGLAAALAALPVAFLVVFYAWPVATIIGRGVGEGGVLDVLRRPEVWRVTWFTLWQAALSTLLTIVIALPAAYVLARYRFRGRRTVLALVTVPFVLPTVVVGAAFLALLPSSWHGTWYAIVLAHVFFNYAVIVRTVGAFWSHLDPGLEEAARVLGASRWRAFVHVTLPLLRPAILAAGSIVFLFCASAFGTALLLGGYRYRTLEVEIYRRTSQLLDLPGAAGLALLQLVLVGGLLTWWARDQERRAVALRLRPAVDRRPIRTRGERALLGANLAVMLLLLGVPLARLVLRSVETPDGWGLDGWRSLGRSGAGTSRAVTPIDAVLTSLRYAVAVAAVATLLGVLASCAIAYSRRGGRWLDAGLMLPLGTSAVTIGFGLLITMNRPPFDLRGTASIVVIAQVLVAMPFVVRSVLPTLRAIDPRLRDAAAVLGASPARTWREVDLPILARSAVAGAAFAFAISLGEFGAAAFLARTGSPTVPLAIVDLLGRPGALNALQAYALAVVLMAVTAAVVLAVEWLRPERTSSF